MKGSREGAKTREVPSSIQKEDGSGEYSPSSRDTPIDLPFLILLISAYSVRNCDNVSGRNGTKEGVIRTVNRVHVDTINGVNEETCQTPTMMRNTGINTKENSALGVNRKVRGYLSG